MRTSLPWTDQLVKFHLLSLSGLGLLSNKRTCSKTWVPTEFTAALDSWASRTSLNSCCRGDNSETDPDVQIGISWSWSRSVQFVRDVQMARGTSFSSSLPVDFRQVCRAAQMALATSQSVYKAISLLKWTPGAKTDFPHRFWGARTVLAAYVHFA